MKKTLCLLLSALMLISALPFVALGASIINLVDLDGIVAPTVDAFPDWDIGTNDSKYEVVHTEWFDHERGVDMQHGEKFLTGHSYRLQIYVEPASGWKFRTDGASGNVFVAILHNGDQIDDSYCIYGDESELLVQIDYEQLPAAESSTINEIDLTIAQPVTGKAPSFTKIDTTRYYSDGNVSPESSGISWYDVTDGKYLINKTTNAKFTCGHTYRVSFSLRTKGDYEFGNATAKVNGKSAVLDWYNPYMVTVTYTFDKFDCAPKFVQGEFPSCNGTGHVGYFACACGKWYWDEEAKEPIEDKEEIVIPPTGAHNYEQVVTKATTTASGKIESKCSVCGDVESSQTIAKIGSVTLSAEKYIYDGKNKTPIVTVKDANGKKLVKNVDYKLSVASKRSGIGRYTVTVTFIGNYSGSKNVYFYILPGKPASVKSASQTTSSVKLSWSAVSGAAGYKVYRYSPAKKAYVDAGSTTGTSLVVKSLLAGTKYTFRVVAYGKTSNGKVYDSDSYAILKTATKTKTPEITKVTASSTKGKAYVYHSNVSGETGYTVYYSTSKNSGFKKYANFKADTTRCDITKLTSGKTYYFKVRTYITTDSGYVYSAWSAVKSVKVN